MKSSSTPRKILRFGPYEVDLEGALLRKHGIRLRIQQQPLKVLGALLDRPGEVVTREQLRQMLWPADTYVDFEQGLNAAVTRLRQTLSDAADTPRFIETHARIGYRFIASVEDVSRTEQSESQATTPGTRPREMLWHSKRLAWLASILLLVTLVPSAIWMATHERHERDIPLKPVPLTTYSGLELTPSFSPDASQVAFEWDQDDGQPHIYVKVVGTDDALRLTYGPGEYGPAWSPDGRQIAFVRGLNTPRVSIYLVPALGGIERKVGEFASSYSVIPHTSSASNRWIDWTPDGKHLIVSGEDTPGVDHGLYLLSLDTGERRWLTNLPVSGEMFDRSPAVAPDGRNVAFCRMTTLLTGEIYTVPLSADLRASEPQKRTSAGRLCASPTWTPEGRDIVFQSNLDGDMALWRIAFQNDGSPSRRLGATGSEVYDPAVAKRGRLAYTRRFVDSNIWRQQISSRTGVRPPPLSLITSTAEDRNPQYSPIDGRIAFQSWRSGNSEVVICGSDGNRCVQLTTMNGPHTGSPRWSPDGKRIAFDSAAAGNFDIYVIDVNGGPPRRLTNDSATDAIPSWSADGKWIYFESARSGTVQIWKIPAEGGAVVQVTRNGGVTAFEATDGKTLYYTKENHLSKLWKSSVDGSGETAVLDGVMMRAFVVFKNRIYYLHPEPGGATELRCFLLATGKDSLVTKIAKPVTLGLSVSPDGSQIIYAQVDHRGSDLSLVDNFR